MIEKTSRTRSTVLAVFVAVALALLARAAGAWSGAGHMLTAEIARERLSPAARAEADRLIAVLAEQDPKVDSFVAASAWMDLLRDHDWKLFNSWHYVNFPINADGLPTVAGARPDNVLAVIADAQANLASPRAGDFVRALSLRLLLHLVGDLHQPLHAVARYTKALPDGDRGGNLFPIATAEKDLHWYWDNAANWLPSLDATKKASWDAAIPALAAKLTAEHPASEFPERSDLDPNVWARESYKLAVAATYEGIAPDTAPSPAYVERAQGVCKRRLALAGYRLAALLEAAHQARAAALANPAGKP